MHVQYQIFGCVFKPALNKFFRFFFSLSCVCVCVGSLLLATIHIILVGGEMNMYILCVALCSYHRVRYLLDCIQAHLDRYTKLVVCVYFFFMSVASVIYDAIRFL